MFSAKFVGINARLSQVAKVNQKVNEVLKLLHAEEGTEIML